MQCQRESCLLELKRWNDLGFKKSRNLKHCSGEDCHVIFWKNQGGKCTKCDEYICNFCLSKLKKIYSFEYMPQYSKENKCKHNWE